MDRGPIPILHTTDLHHPPIDPDDHVDLLTAYALPELDLRGVVLDVTGDPATSSWEPGLVPLAQLNYLTGRAVPVAISPIAPLASPEDDCRERPLREQAGVRLLLDVLRRSDEPVVVSVVGSCRTVAAAFNREPALLRAKVRAVLANIGALWPSVADYNVGLDAAAWIRLLRSGLRIDWFPCVVDANDFEVEDPEAQRRLAFFAAPQRRLFADIAPSLKAWLIHSYTGNLRGDILRPLHAQRGQPDKCGRIWQTLLGARRELWSPASLVMAAGRGLARTADGWRFVATADAAPAGDRETLELDHVAVDVDDRGITSWRPAGPDSPVRMFRRDPGPRYAQAMTEALNALLRSLLP